MNEEKQEWAVLDCGKYPSEMNCRIKMMAPAEQVDQVIELAARHACDVHGHSDNQELRQALRTLIEYEVK